MRSFTYSATACDLLARRGDPGAYDIRSNVYFERAETEYYSNPRSVLPPVREPMVALVWDVARLTRYGYRLRAEGVTLPDSLVDLPALDLDDVHASLERAADKLLASGIAERR